MKNEGLPEEIGDAVARGDCLALVLSGKRKSAVEVEADRLDVRPIIVRGEALYQFAWRTGNRETHENLGPDESRRRIERFFGSTFEHCHAFTPEADYHARARRGTVKLQRKPPSKSPATRPAAHDRAKQRIIPEGTPCAFLSEIGVMSPAGDVKARMTKKFRQINRFLELVDDIVPRLPAGPLEIVDFGCGKSYLTFALDHLLRNVHGRTARIIGLDLKEDVLADCRRVAERLDLSHIEFRMGDIAAYRPERPVDLAVCLHACDTATDAALAQAIRWETPVILAVPCCQHELASTIDSRELSGVLRHGILKERFAALATDALRADMLEQAGYHAQVVEFIDLEHTAKNLLIRAVRRAPDAERGERIDEYRSLKKLLGISDFHLERALANNEANDATQDETDHEVCRPDYEEHPAR